MTSLSLQSQTGPWGAYMKFTRNMGIFLVMTRQVPRILPSASREMTASHPQPSLTFGHLSDCMKLPYLLVFANCSYSSSRA